MSDGLQQVAKDLIAVGGVEDEVRLLELLVNGLKPADVRPESWLSFSFLEGLVASNGEEHFPSFLVHCCTDVVRLLVPRYVAVVTREWGEDTIQVPPPESIENIVTDPETGDELGTFRNVARIGFSSTERLRELVSPT